MSLEAKYFCMWKSEEIIELIKFWKISLKVHILTEGTSFARLIFRYYFET